MLSSITFSKINICNISTNGFICSFVKVPSFLSKENKVIERKLRASEGRLAES